MKTLDEYAAQVGEANEKWWVNPATGEPIERNVGEMLMLVVSELAEALEGERKGLMDDKLPQYKMFEVEIVDAVIRLFDIAGHMIPKFHDEFVGESEAEPCEDLNGYAQIVVPDYAAISNIGQLLMYVNVQLCCAFEDSLDEDDDRFAMHVTTALKELFEIAHRFMPETFQEIFDAKMAFNAQRVDHKLANRLLPGGKKF